MDARSDRDALARGLETAVNSFEALRLWAGVAAPPADLVAVIDPVTLAPTPALGRQGAEWLQVNLPQVRLSEIPDRVVTVSLAGGRRQALDDLLLSLGFDQALVAPFAERAAGALLLARTGAAYTTADAGAEAEHAALLGRALAGLARRRPRDRREPGATREGAELFDLAQRLAQADDATAAARAAASTLEDLLQPKAGAVLLRVVESEPPVDVAWPQGTGGARAIVRAAESAGMPVPASAREADLAAARASDAGLFWLSAPAPTPAVGLALGFADRVPDSAARLAGAVQALLAVTAGRLATQRLSEEDRLRAVVEALPQGVALLAADYRIRLVNPAGRRHLESLWAWPGDGGRLDRIGSADLAPLVVCARRGLRGAAEIYSSAGGRTFEIQVVPAGPVSKRDERGSGDTVLILDDVTEERRRKTQLARAEKLSAMGVLISGIVHEINNPLGTILGCAEMISTSPEGEKRDGWLRTLADETRRCQRIVSNLLTFARPQTPGRQRTSLGAIAEKALELVSHSFRSARIDAVLEVAPETPAVDVDPDAVLQALINLLTNALHALEDFDGPRRVSVTIGPVGEDKVVVAVQDTGPGIAPEDRDRVFDPFYTTKPEGKGTGLGLTTVVATMRDHGGVIEVDNATDGGACFRMTLPLATPTAPSAGEESSADGVDRPALAGTRVLIADGEAPVADGLAAMLERAGARPEVHKDGPAALKALLDWPPDAVIWDLSLAGVSGASLLDELDRRAPELVSRLIFVGGEPEEAGTVSGRRPAPPVMGKPLDLPAVVRTVRRVARGHRPGAA